jgi:hypothetical protein
MTKLCNICSCGLDAGNTYAGVQSRCVPCHKTRMKEIRLTNPAVQERERARAKLPHRRALAAKTRVRWREEHPEAYRAQTAVGNAIRDGKLRKQPCTICGSNDHVHAHHSDYSKPLDVKWLCARCHHRMHAAFPQLAGHQGAAP